MFCLFGHRPGASEVGAGEPANFADIEKGIEAEIDNLLVHDEWPPRFLTLRRLF